MDAPKNIKILILPDELLQEIFLKLDWNSIFRTILTCSKFRQILEDELFWQTKCNADFGKQSPLITKMPISIKDWSSQPIEERNNELTDYYLAWRPERWQIRYRRIMLANRVNHSISGGDGSYGYINSEGKVIVNSNYCRDVSLEERQINYKNLETIFPKFFQKLVQDFNCMPTERDLPIRLINYSYDDAVGQIILENGEVYSCYNVLKELHKSNHHHNLIKIVDGKFFKFQACSLFIMDDLTGYIKINLETRYEKIIKLPILVRDVTFDKNMAIFLGKDLQIYLFRFGGQIVAKSLGKHNGSDLIDIQVTEIEIPILNSETFQQLKYLGHFYKISYQNYQFQEISLNRRGILALTSEGEVWQLYSSPDRTKVHTASTAREELYYRMTNKLTSAKSILKFSLGKKISIKEKVFRIFAFQNANFCLTVNHELYGWDSLPNYVFYNSNTNHSNLSQEEMYYTSPVKIDTGKYKVKSIFLGFGHMILVFENDHLQFRDSHGFKHFHHGKAVPERKILN